MVEMVKSMRANPGISGVIWLRYGASDVTGNSKNSGLVAKTRRAPHGSGRWGARYRFSWCSKLTQPPMQPVSTPSLQPVE